jgi:hypothetical protein
MDDEITPKKEEKQKAEVDCEAWKLWKRAVEERDIDPADFFDPEEFGYRRLHVHG